MWPAPQQRKGAEDFAFTVMVFMLQLPWATAYPSKALLQGLVHVSQLPTLRGGGLTRMRGRIFASLVYAALDPPSDLCAVFRG